MTLVPTPAAAVLGLFSTAAIVIGEAHAGGFDYGPLANIGAMGAVLAWLMWRVEPRLKALEESIDRNTRATLLVIVDEAIKNEAVKITAETDAAEQRRKGK